MNRLPRAWGGHRWRIAPIGVLVPLAVIALAPPTAAARADIFVLHGEGQVRGELVNKDQSPRTTYEVRTPGGGLVTLDAAQLKHRVRQSANEMEYDRRKLAAPDTLEGQWAMAEWCFEKHLGKQRKRHLERVLEFDPDHKQARLALGYTRFHGQWTTEEERMLKDGYVKYKGVWQLPQQVALTKQKRDDELRQKDWFRKLKMWRGWLDSNKADDARTHITAIDDPYATKALASYLGNEDDRQVKMLYLDALTQINTPASLGTLASSALYDDDEEIRLACLDRLVRKQFRQATGTFVQSLKSKDNAIVNRAGVALAQLQDPSTVGPLIDALITTHKRQIIRGQPGQTTSTFGSGPGGGAGTFGFGSPPVVTLHEQMNNPAVLNALVGLTGVNFEYDTHAWRYWNAAKKKPNTTDARRD